MILEQVIIEIKPFLMGQNLLTPKQFFSALYANPDIKEEPMSGGRQMGAHFVTPSINSRGEWLDLTSQFNHSSDISPTAGQIPRSIGLALASKLYRNIDGEIKINLQKEVMKYVGRL